MLTQVLRLYNIALVFLRTEEQLILSAHSTEQEQPSGLPDSSVIPHTQI